MDSAQDGEANSARVMIIENTLANINSLLEIAARFTRNRRHCHQLRIIDEVTYLIRTYSSAVTESRNFLLVLAMAEQIEGIAKTTQLRPNTASHHRQRG